MKTYKTKTTINKNLIEDLLSARELEILMCMACGQSRSTIAEQLSISVLTYDEHRKNIRNKLGLQSNADWARALMPFMK